MNSAREVVLVAGVRTPFTAVGGDLATLDTVALGRIAAREVLERADLAPDDVGALLVARTGGPPDLARAIGRGAGIPVDVPTAGIERHAASGLEAIVDAVRRIRSDEAGVAIVAAADSASAARGFAAMFGRSATEPRLAAAERLAGEFGVERDEQEAFASRSHRLAAAAWSAGRASGEVVPVPMPPDWDRVVQRDEAVVDDGVAEMLARQRPAVDPRWGTVTAATVAADGDGAAALVLASSERARELGLPRLARIRGWASAGCELERSGLAPALALPRALRSAGGLALDRVDLLEIEESSAAEILVCGRALESRRFCEDRLGSGPVGHIDPERLNVNGGSLATGRPAAAAGLRLLLALASELERRDLARGLAVAGTDGGEALAVVIERD